MAVTDTWYTGTDWECSSGPIIARRYRHVAGDVDCAADNNLWPIGVGSELPGASDKDVLADGDHMAVAIGPRASRPNNMTGVVLSFDATLGFAEVNVADKFVSKHYVSNVNDWTTQGAATGYHSPVNIGDPVYIDDTSGLPAGVNLSFSPLNGDATNAANPLFGYVHYDQHEYRTPGSHIIPGFPDSTDRWPIVTLTDGVEYVLVCIMQVNDSGQSRALLTE